MTSIFIPLKIISFTYKIFHLSSRSFLKALVTFPKPLIAGVIGSCSGIGVTMLPAFDAVVSSDKSTFETAYAKIGQIPEGNCLLTSTTNVRHSFVSWWWNAYFSFVFKKLYFNVFFFHRKLNCFGFAKSWLLRRQPCRGWLQNWLHHRKLLKTQCNVLGG